MIRIMSDILVHYLIQKLWNISHMFQASQEKIRIMKREGQLEEDLGEDSVEETMEEEGLVEEDLEVVTVEDIKVIIKVIMVEVAMDKVGMVEVDMVQDIKEVMGVDHVEDMAIIEEDTDPETNIKCLSMTSHII